MKRVVLLFLFTVWAFVSCTQVEPGYRALKVYALGEKKGKIEVVGVGRHAVHWFGYYDYYKYPTNVQQWSWTASGKSSKGVNQEITFQVEGQELKADIGIEYTFATASDATFTKMFEYFRCEPDQIVDRFMWKDICSYFNKIVANMKVEEAYSVYKDSILTEVFHQMSAKYIELGINIGEVTYLSPIRLPETIKLAIDTKIAAKQTAEARQNEVAEEIAAADKLREAAKGRADAMDMEGAALARNPQILRLKELEVQHEMAQNLKGLNTLVIPPGQSSLMIDLGKK
jgi:regulator of protease activity HflC (stomatin/prohibitin superfamily)